jgi:hypothetical protein
MKTSENRITQMQLELLKSFQFVTDEKQLKEIKSLLRLYFQKNLDAAIDKVEKKNGFTSAIYEEWLSSNQNKSI